MRGRDALPIKPRAVRSVEWAFLTLRLCLDGAATWNSASTETSNWYQCKRSSLRTISGYNAGRGLHFDCALCGMVSSKRKSPRPHDAHERDRTYGADHKSHKEHKSAPLADLYMQAGPSFKNQYASLSSLKLFSSPPHPDSRIRSLANRVLSTLYPEWDFANIFALASLAS